MNLSLVKGGDNLIELKVQGKSEDIAISCAKAIFEKIELAQKEITEPYIEEAKSLLSQHRSRLTQIKAEINDLSKISKPSSLMILQDEARLLMAEIIKINSTITMNSNRYARLVSPIYGSKTAIYPKNNKALTLGFFLGIVIGFLLGVFRVIKSRFIKLQIND
jgi:uncharacterized protein involved in exopolysaccharide biosynthesis